MQDRSQSYSLHFSDAHFRIDQNYDHVHVTLPSVTDVCSPSASKIRELPEEDRHLEGPPAQLHG